MLELLPRVSLTTIMFHFIEEQVLKKLFLKGMLMQVGALNNCYSKR